MDRIAVLIPCYNEATAIRKVVADFRETLPEATVYVYDNNSTDGTGDLARSMDCVVRPEYQQGKGNVIRRRLTRNATSWWTAMTPILLRRLVRCAGWC